MSSKYEILIAIAFLALVALFVQYYVRSMHRGISSVIEDTEGIFKTTADKLGLSFYPGEMTQSPLPAKAYPEIRGRLNGFEVRIAVYQDLGYAVEVTELYTSIEVDNQNGNLKQYRDHLDVPIDQLSPASREAEIKSRFRTFERLYGHGRHPLPVSLPAGQLRSRAYRSEIDNGSLRILIRNRENTAGLYSHPAPYDLESLVREAVMAYAQMQVSSDS